MSCATPDPQILNYTGPHRFMAHALWLQGLAGVPPTIRAFFFLARQ